MNYYDEYKKWVDGPIDEATRQELSLIAGNAGEIESRFHAPLKFGTGGLRGILGAGINRMNIYVVRQATQGMANLILKQGANVVDRGVVIAYDSRNLSAEFAEEAACVLAANGIKAYLFDGMRPTPVLSFSVRKLGAIAGINITASHNPKEYNGYKAYWEDGAQLSQELSEKVLAEIGETDIFNGVKTMRKKKALRKGAIVMVGAALDEKYLAEVLALAVNPDAAAKAADDIKIVYTPFHGAGRHLVVEVLRRTGLKNIITVEEQMVPDGNFSTVKSPNPEEKESFHLAAVTAKEHNADIIIGTDPDADRMGVLVRDDFGEYRILDGNQIGLFLLCYIIDSHRKNGTLQKDAAVITTIVSTLMADIICEKNGVALFKVYTGFKYIAEKIKEFEDTGKHSFLFGFEESFGYLAGNHARDKDAVYAAMIFSEAAAYYKLKGVRITDVMEDIYKKYGYYGEKTINVTMPGVDGIAKMNGIMSNLRGSPPADIAGFKVSAVEDYLKGKAFITETKKELPLSFSPSDVLIFRFSDGSAVAIRPSGTEPKVKCYILVKGSNKEDMQNKLTLLYHHVCKILC